MANRRGRSDRLCFLGLQNHCEQWLQPWNWKTLAPWKESYDKARQCIKSQSHHFAGKDPYSQSFGFPVIMYRCESWIIKKAECWRIEAFELWCWRTLESLLDNREIKPVNPKGNQFWVVTGRTDAEAEAPAVWPPEAKSGFIGKDPDARKDWRQKKWLNSITDSMDVNLSKLWEAVEGGGAWLLRSPGSQRVRHKGAT